MTQLLFGFYGEGPRDYGFLMPLIERVLQDMLPHTDILPLDVRVDKSDLSQIDKMLVVAEETNGFSLAIFHLDADGPNTTDAYNQRFEPGYLRVLDIEDGVNRVIVPVIPVRMTEAWMLVDFEAFCKVVGTRETANTLGFPGYPRQVESIQLPKTVFEMAIEKAIRGRKHRKRIKPDEVYRPLAQRLDLGLLAQVPAYQEFEGRLRETLKRLHYLDDE